MHNPAHENALPHHLHFPSWTFPTSPPPGSLPGSSSLPSACHALSLVAWPSLPVCTSEIIWALGSPILCSVPSMGRGQMC